jgi:hypothetical protein
LKLARAASAVPDATHHCHHGKDSSIRHAPAITIIAKMTMAEGHRDTALLYKPSLWAFAPDAAAIIIVAKMTAARVNDDAGSRLALCASPLQEDDNSREGNTQISLRDARSEGHREPVTCQSGLPFCRRVPAKQLER